MDSVLQAPNISSLSDEIGQALQRLDFKTLSAEYGLQDEVLFIEHFLPSKTLQPLLDEVEQLTPLLNRNYIPGHKKGGSVSHFIIAEKAPYLLAFYHSEVLRDFLSRLAGVDLKLCPKNDPHACALYFYTEDGDHMGYHYDTSYYEGKRYTVLVGLIQNSSSRLLCRLNTRRPEAEQKEMALETVPGSMVIFNGDKLYHAVSPNKEGEKRVIFTMEFVTDTRIKGAKRIFSNLKDAFAYFGVKSFWQAIKRS